MATVAAKKTWTHKVVKQARGMQGQWFAYPAAMTGFERDALAYAESFAAERRGVAGARITVQSRGGRIVKIIPVQS